ncbi:MULTISPECIES: hypothetical protein [unclassified Moorena]|nr:MULTISPECIES: hypothetical protein [unclassified Moorena]
MLNLLILIKTIIAFIILNRYSQLSSPCSLLPAPCSLLPIRGLV